MTENKTKLSTKKVVKAIKHQTEPKTKGWKTPGLSKQLTNLYNKEKKQVDHYNPFLDQPYN